LQDDVNIAANNVIDIFVSIDPKIILAKVKLHLLTHLQMDIRRSSPLVGCSTEVYESFNADSRRCSVLSNRQAPSRDIAVQFGKHEGFKATGGWGKAENEDWIQVGPGIKPFVANNPEFLENVWLSSGTPDVPDMSHINLAFQKIRLTAYSPIYRMGRVGCL
jgi:hypothetical protein